MSRFIPVEPEKWGEMVKAWAENPKLKAEVERLTSVSEAWKKRRLDKVEAECINWAEVEKENARLKAEVDRLTKQNALATPRHLIASQDIKTLREQIEELKLENSQYEEHHKYGQNVITSLREEVERLTAFTTRTIIPNEELQAQVERLTQAGDAFYESEIGYYGEQILNDPKHHTGQLCRDWNAAKEGKQP
jgi:chromosome segregation ATPase